MQQKGKRDGVTLSLGICESSRESGIWFHWFGNVNFWNLRKGNCKIQVKRTWDLLDSWREIDYQNSNEQLIGFILRRVKSSRCNRVLGKFRYDTWLAVLLWVGIIFMKSVGKFKTMQQAARL